MTFSLMKHALLRLDSGCSVYQFRGWGSQGSRGIAGSSMGEPEKEESGSVVVGVKDAGDVVVASVVTEKDNNVA